GPCDEREQNTKRSLIDTNFHFTTISRPAISHRGRTGRYKNAKGNPIGPESEFHGNGLVIKCSQIDLLNEDVSCGAYG
ncbi:hypothetical protein BaRGS_00031807, partial [Batillaria attramentaria]